MIRQIPVTEADFKSITCSFTALDLKLFRARQQIRLDLAVREGQTVTKLEYRERKVL